MKKNHSEIVCILDRSGSMSCVRNDAIGGFNTFLEEQKKVEGTADVTLILFDDQYIVTEDKSEINGVEPLNNKTYVPRGSTSLYDAIGKTINTIGERLANTSEKERPENVIVAILTDGNENSSVEFSQKQIFDMIKHQSENYNWNFVYLAANQDSMEVGAQMGFGANNTMDFSHDSDGVAVAYAAVSNYTKSTRMGETVSLRDSVEK